jgi:hypothetical protein
MPIALAALRATLAHTLGRLPRAVWAGLALVGLVGLAGTVGARRIAHYGAARAAAARAAVQAEAARVAPMQRVVVQQRAARVDTVRLRVVQQVTRVETLVVRVPERVRTQFPVVDSLVRACTALAQDCSTLRRATADERAAREALERTLSLVLTAQRDSLQAARRRPTWGTALGVAGLVGASVWLGGRR